MHIKSTSRKIVDQSIHRAMHTRIFHVTAGHVEQFTHAVRWEGPEEELEYEVTRERSRR